MTIVVNGALNPKIISKFPSKYPVENFFNFVSNNVNLEGVLAVAGMLFPEFVEREGGIFLGEGYQGILSKKESLSTRFGNDLKTVERYVNLFCVSDFFLLTYDEACGEETLLIQLADTLKKFWLCRLNCKFPEKKFEFEIENDLFDESGLCVTFSQEEK